MKLRIATRASALAVWQAEHVRAGILAAHPALEVELVKLTTRGDQILDRPLAEVGGKGLFVKEIEQALLDGTADLAVHSLKDMPTEQPEGLELSVFPERGPTFDVLCHAAPGATLETLPQGARIGTSSLRRAAQLKNIRPDLEIVSVRGNVQTRLSKRFDEELGLAAVVLAAAGLERLGLWEEGFERLEPPRYLPAPGQGALAIETRAGDAVTLARISHLDHPLTRAIVAAERGCLEGIEGNCHTPFAAWSFHVRNELHLRARLLEPDGHMTEGRRMIIAESPTVDEARQLGLTLARNLLERHHSSLPRS